MKLKNITKRILCVMLAAAAVGLSAAEREPQQVASAEPETDEIAERLEEIERRQQELDEKIAEADSSAEGERRKLEAVDKKIESIAEEISACEEYSAKLEDEMVALDEKMRKTQADLEEQDAKIRQELEDYMGRLRALYLAGSFSYTDVILESSDFYDVLMRAELISRVAKHDSDELDRMLERFEEIKTLQAELDAESEELKQKASEYSDRYTELTGSRAELEELKQQYGDELDAIQDELDSYEEEQQQIDEDRRQATTTTTTTTTTTAPPDEPEPEETAAETTTKKTAAAATQTAQPETAAPAETTAPAKEQPPEETTKQTTAATSKQTSKTTEAPAPAAPDASKAETVVAYAKSNVGGSYVWGGASFKACDCSGLVMLAYSQVGISLPHYTGYQASYGREVAYSDMQPGDCIYFGTSPANSYHVAMYIGGGRMVHAENSRTGIVISNVATFSIYNHICCIRRFL